ncbi:MAG: type I secretion system permease/ATPase [Alphaproteobacteria bacterium]|nr:MAG: type I secretion system permease/ATPase [Alphaproteobacteria bacterium]
MVSNAQHGHWLWPALLRNRGIYAQVLLAAAFVNVLSLASSLFIMTVYDRVIPHHAIESLIALAIGMAIALTVDFVLRSLRGYFIDIAGQRVDYDIGSTLFARVLDMRLAERRGSAGSFAGAIREFETLRDFFASATLVALVDLPFIVIFLFVIGMIGGWIVLVPIAAVPIVFAVGLLIQPALARLATRALHEGQGKHGVLVETVAGLETVKSVAAGRLLAQRWQRGLADHAITSRRSRILSQLAINVASTVQQAAQVGTVIVGVFLVMGGALSVGGLIACVILTGRTLAPLSQLAQVLSRVNGALSSYRSLERIMKGRTDHEDGRAYLRRPRLDGKIAFRNVVFRYPGQSVRALDDISFTIEPGEKVAILGRVGSGKSSITRLILGLYEPDEGAVLVDDTDVRQILPDDLRANIGSVLQDVYLLSGSIRENIALGAPGADDAAVLRVAKIAGVHDFVGQIPSGYDLRLADRGEGLSGGQRQAIAVARALIGNPPIVLLDEPTSAMDVNSENALISRLESELAERTVLLITHRASMLKLVERVIILDRGRIVAAGPRDDVLKSTAVGRQD